MGVLMAGPAPGGGRPSPAHPVCSQIAVKSVPFLNTDVWSKELLWALTRPDRTQQEQPPEKVRRPCIPASSPRRPCLDGRLQQGPGPQKKRGDLTEAEGRGLVRGSSRPSGRRGMDRGGSGSGQEVDLP